MVLNIKSSRMKISKGEFKINITRANGSILAPSFNLLKRFKFQKKTMGLTKAWENFIIDFIFEMDNDESIQAMEDIAKLSLKRDVTLVCSCVDAEHCHRSLVKRMIENRYL